ncbi:MAG: hypothetical protein PHX33_07840 [Candidatus Cloacimonetes bacterium]|nr:hypothetical protein [Candidatus Cloacimonadota bacterium]
MIKQVIDEKIKRIHNLLLNQDLKEYFKKNPLDLSDESIIHLIHIAINTLETIFYIYTQQLKDKEKTNDKTSN